MIARVTVSLKPGVLDPQGRAIEHALDGLGFENIESVRQGKLIEIAFDDALDANDVRPRVEEMCRRLLVNSVTERYAIELVEVAR